MIFGSVGLRDDIYEDMTIAAAATERFSRYLMPSRECTGEMASARGTAQYTCIFAHWSRTIPSKGFWVMTENAQADMVQLKFSGYIELQGPLFQCSWLDILG